MWSKSFQDSQQSISSVFLSTTLQSQDDMSYPSSLTPGFRKKWPRMKEVALLAGLQRFLMVLGPKVLVPRRTIRRETWWAMRALSMLQNLCNLK
jgi:hypothetical protein